MNEEKKKEYFITRYSLIPDAQIDLESFTGISKEEKFLNWMLSFKQEKRKEIDCRGTHYALYCKQVTDKCFFISFAKELEDIIGEKTDDGIKDTLISNYKKCNIIVNTYNQWMIIEKNSDISQNIINQKNIIANVISNFIKSKDLYFELGFISEKNDFWQFVTANKDSITDIDITLSSPNFLRGIKTVNELLHETNESYNNTSVSVHLRNEEGRLNIDKNNEFLQDAIRYSSAGCGKWRVKSTANKKGYSNEDNPFIIRLPECIGELKDSDIKTIESAFEHIKHLDPEHKEE